jgi:hypothetical protein
MTLKFLSSLLNKSDEDDATGTYADGVFHLALGKQVAADKENCLRASYAQDHRTILKLDSRPAAFM